MEEFSLISKEETASDKSESDKKKKKRAEALGAFLVDSKPETSGSKKKEADKSERHWLPFEREPAEKKEAGHELSEAKSPLDKLSDEEVGLVRSLSAEEKLAALQEASGTGESPEAAYGDLLVEDFLKQVAYEAAEPEEALQQTLAEAGIEEMEFETEQEPPADEAPREFAELDTEIYLHEAPPPETNEPAEKTELDETGGEPPRPPIRPAARGEGDDHSPRRSRKSLYDTVPGAFDTNLHRVLPDRLRTEYLSNYNEAGLLDAALVGGTGGIVGYLMGRRRGRIKTEKKLLPTQKRLEKQVKDLQGELQVQETKLRKLAATRVQARGPVVIERFQEIIRSRPVKTEAIQPLANQPRAPEHLGHMVVVAEAKPNAPRKEVARPEKVVERQPKPGETVVKVDKNIATMNRAELLELSDKIVIDGASLRQIYETRLVGERGLRRLVSEHLQGGNVKKLLRQEIIEREIDFERDPAMRDQAAQGVEGGGGGSLKDMLDRAGASKTGSEEEAAFYKARAAYDLQQRTVQRQHRRLVDVSMAATIAILIALILILLLSRH